VAGARETRRLHTFPMAGGGIQCASSADKNRDRPKLSGERQSERETTLGKEKEGQIVMAREHHRGREKKGEMQTGTFV